MSTKNHNQLYFPAKHDMQGFSGHLALKTHKTKVISSDRYYLIMHKMITYDTCHEKTDLKVIFGAIPKEGLAGWGLANPSLGMRLTIKYYSTTFKDYIL